MKKSTMLITLFLEVGELELVLTIRRKRVASCWLNSILLFVLIVSRTEESAMSMLLLFIGVFLECYAFFVTAALILLISSQERVRQRVKRFLDIVQAMIQCANQRIGF